MALAAVFLGSCGSSTSSLEPATTTDADQITTAFNNWEDLPSTCAGAIIAGSLKVTTVSGTGWAIAQFRPPDPCIEYYIPAGGTPADEQRKPMSTIAPWGSVPLGVFERHPGGRWMMNETGGIPFPCPARGGRSPGPYNGALPTKALTAFHLKYAAGCATVHYQDQPPTT